MNPPADNPFGLQTVAERERLLLAPYAVFSADSRGRQHPEAQHPYRGPFQRDRDRVIHTAAYRRLSHKTQVFTGELGDYHRSRLTHTLEVSSVARTVARALRLNEDLVEAMALLHDIGHPPFGHAGEDTLDELLVDEGGFSHNRQALRIVQLLEKRYRGFTGINLSYEVLEGQGFRANKEAAAEQPSLEAQVVDAADSIAYNSHDADDALQLGLLTIDDLLEVPLWRTAAERVGRSAADLDDLELRQGVVHELIDWQASDLLRHSAEELRAADYRNADEVRRQPRTIRQSDELAEQKGELERFLFQRVYRHPQVLKVRQRAQNQLSEMFAYFVAHPKQLPLSFSSRVADEGPQRTVGDYLAGMTDRFAQSSHQQLRMRPDWRTSTAATG
ncbi:MAG: deoxyguanosinetriphosphate triphosphohydrolase [Planctomycetales bacterium]|nr:deoxyguanosinetriphosphate triphosphohydrolase [Planctomycetales bacterium]NIM08756.1 deoxyguanosinetriphosphate triphosphohydrolase [Planctomycetales bacterium]NIN08219.1 deoxyguanosinetriphosphate triphosphohydrolase [Planctomycetales bacterium]NIN77347.1 deoxyguanosinetriphosphate triphosphohydrolase [Planctomycetales bacterium]NIO34530.1 deoxyguanosinetriphosphate triphosphohydrolase [Planctomycetales bacterium]